jgi:hypothetical protein
MRKTLSVFLISGTMSAALAMAPAAIPQALAAPASHAVAMHAQGVPGCKDNNYSCGYQQGYRQGFLDGRSARQAGLCAHHHKKYGAYGTPTASERGYQEGYSTAFAHYCPA